ncbi:hypothetical protein LCGC14_0086710 [marine sediment metagenome]|uniref:Homoserine/homoserine lactone efflux protein n=1 Tax=marine sediment metagenome TaxID=412755 RepID=A0A0F9VWG6_9ZZZZ|nr:homoserine/homoserine lactone efflux protein [Halomonas sp.]HDZ46368.1 homoserine/homoserine lactone efflux protein [Halomonas sp.]HEB04561.1 homoserine/homoserine lactone efflux protein [Halomonas sp.]
MSFSIWLTFLMASIFISLSPGAGAIKTMNSGMNYGFRSAIPTIFGLQLGYGIQIFIVAIGLGAIIASSTASFLIIKWGGVLYLIWLGIQKWKSAERLVTIENKVENQKKQFWQSAFVNLTNPKATVFLVALFPQFLTSNNTSHETQLLLMAATLLIVDLAVMFFYAALASHLKSFIKSEPRMKLINRVFGSFFIFAGIALAAYQKN